MPTATTDFTSLAAFPSDWRLVSFVAGVKAAGDPSKYAISGGYGLFDYTSAGATESGAVAQPPAFAGIGSDGKVEVTFRNPTPFAASTQDELVVVVAAGFRANDALTAWIGAAVTAHWDGSTWDNPFLLSVAQPSGAGLALSGPVTPPDLNRALDIWAAVNSISAEVRGDDLVYAFNGVLVAQAPGAAAAVTGAEPVVFVQVYEVTGGVRTNLAVVREVLVSGYPTLPPLFEPAPTRVKDVTPIPHASLSMHLPMDDMVSKGLFRPEAGGDTFTARTDVLVNLPGSSPGSDEVGKAYLIPRGTRLVAITQRHGTIMRAFVVDYAAFRNGYPT